MKIGLAQINTRVGAIDANTRKILDYSAHARELGCELVLFPELTLCGYPPEDLRRNLLGALTRFTAAAQASTLPRGG